MEASRTPRRHPEHEAELTARLLLNSVRATKSYGLSSKRSMICLACWQCMISPCGLRTQRRGMHLLLWFTLVADSVTLGFTVYAAARRPLLIDFFVVSLAMCVLGFALHEVLAQDRHLFILFFTFVMSLILTYRLSRLWERSGT